MQEAIAQRANFDRLVSRISTAFVASTDTDIDLKIQQALASIGAFIQTDRAYVFLFHGSSAVADNTHEWCAAGVEAQIERLKRVPIDETLPWFYGRIRKGETFCIQSVSALPPEACRERAHFEAQSIQSLLVVPMISGERLFGFIGFDAVAAPRDWSEEDLSLLHFVGEIFVTALERKHWERLLKESRDRLDLAIKGTDAGLWDWNVQTGEVIFDQRWAEMIGYDLSELEPLSIQTWKDHCHPEDLARSGIELEKHFSGKTESYICEARMRHKKGNWIWVLDRGKVVSWDETGKPTRMVGTHVDITDKTLQDAITQAERDMATLWSCVGSLKERLAVCLNTAIQVASMDSGGLYLVDESNGSLSLQVHQGLSEAFIDKAQVYSSDSSNAELVRKGEPVFRESRGPMTGGEELLEFEGLKSTAILPVLFRGRAIACLNLASHTMENLDERSRNAARRIAGYLGSFIVQEMLEEKTRQAGRDLDALFNTIQDMLFILDLDGCILAHNKAAANRLGYGEEELIGRNVLSVHPPDRREEVLDVVARMIANELEYCHIPLLTKSGALIPVETKVILGHWKSRKALYGISRDISERLQLEQQARQIEKAESLRRMAGSIAHNFNNMLTVVSGNLQLAILGLQHGNEISEFLSESFQAAGRAAELTNRMLTYLGQSNVKHELLDLSEVFRRIYPALENENRGSADFEIDLPDSGPIIKGNAHQIDQLARNLVANAVESLGESHGLLRISIRTVPPSAIPRKRYPAGLQPQNVSYACLEIKDSGCGIPESNLGKIFDPFFSTKFTGRGLGLPVALGIVREHEGMIALESVPGKGSVFCVFLPLSETKSEA